MANDRYILPVLDENGVEQEVELAALSYGYTGVAVLDELGVAHDIASEPEEDPPSGEFPVLDESGTQHLIAFRLAEATGLYELTQNALYAAVEELCGIPGSERVDALNIACFYENAPADEMDPEDVVGWATARIDWGPHEVLAFGSRVGRYRLRGDLIVTFYVGLEVGVASLLDMAQRAIAALRSRTLTPVRTLDAYHIPTQRDGSWWTCEVRCEFRADRDYDIA